MTRKRAEEIAILIKRGARAEAHKVPGTVDTWTTQVVDLGAEVAAELATDPVRVADCLPTGWSFARSDNLTTICVGRRL